MKKCPFCAEEIQEDAIICRFCGRDIINNIDGQVTYSKKAIEPIEPSLINSSIASLQYITKLVSYAGESEMNVGIKQMQRAGWEVVSTNSINRGWDSGKTCCLGEIFLPLALFGKMENHYQVTFRRRLLSEIELRSHLQSINFKVDDSSDLNTLITYSQVTKNDIDKLSLQTENPAALKIISQLEEKHQKVLSRIKQIQIQQVLSQREKFVIEIPYSNDEDEVINQLRILEEDIKLLNTAPEDSFLSTEIMKDSQTKEGLQVHLTDLITKRVLGSLMSSPIQKPFTRDVEEIEEQQEFTRTDIETLSSYKHIPALANVLSNRKITGRKLRNHLFFTNFTNWWKKTRTENDKLIKIVLIIIAIAVVIGITLGLLYILKK